MLTQIQITNVLNLVNALSTLGEQIGTSFEYHINFETNMLEIGMHQDIVLLQDWNFDLTVGFTDANFNLLAYASTIEESINME